MIFMSDEAEKSEGIQNFSLKDKNWLFLILLFSISKSSEKYMFYWKTM